MAETKTFYEELTICVFSVSLGHQKKHKTCSSLFHRKAMATYRKVERGDGGNIFRNCPKCCYRLAVREIICVNSGQGKNELSRC